MVGQQGTPGLDPAGHEADWEESRCYSEGAVAEVSLRVIKPSHFLAVLSSDLLGQHWEQGQLGSHPRESRAWIQGGAVQVGRAALESGCFESRENLAAKHTDPRCTLTALPQGKHFV